MHAHKWDITALIYGLAVRLIGAAFHEAFHELLLGEEIAPELNSG